MNSKCIKKIHNPQIYRTIMYRSRIFAFIFLISLHILLVASQSTEIDDRSCNVDSDCSNDDNVTETSWLNKTETRLGNFMCVQNKCKFVVAAGQQCREVTDCVAYHYSVLHKIPLNDICSPKNCNLGSKCAWEQKEIPSIPDIDEQTTCCVGLPNGFECNIVAIDVNPCSSKCIFDKDTNVAKCADDGSQKKDIWIGVLICLIGSATLNVGLNIQKFAFTKYQEELDKQPMTDNVDDDNISMKNSITSLGRSNLYKKLEKFMFWKQIIVSPLWVFGFGIYVVGSLLGFVALKFAPQSLVAPLGAVSLVVNLLIAPILHNQKLTKWDIIGVLIIIGGSIFITIFSGIVVQDYKLCILIELFKRTQTIIYLSCIGIFIFGLYTFIRVVERNAAQKDVDALKTVAAAAAAVAEQEKIENEIKSKTNLMDKKIPIIDEEKDNTLNTDQSISIKLDENRKDLSQSTDQTLAAEQDDSHSKKSAGNHDISLEDEIMSIPTIRDSTSSSTKSVVRQHSVKEKVLLPLAYAILASSMATITTLFAKSLINLLSVSFSQQDNQFNDLLSWMILLITISTAIGQIYWISMGLKKYDALLQVPIFYCNWSLFDIIGGGIYYDEFRHFRAGEYVGFIIGISLIFFGVSLLSKRLAKLTKEEEKLKEIEKKWEEMKKKNKRKRSTTETS